MEAINYTSMIMECAGDTMGPVTDQVHNIPLNTLMDDNIKIRVMVSTGPPTQVTGVCEGISGNQSASGESKDISARREAPTGRR
eukprot:3365297-Pyramimonas_sp.AAC.1